MSSDDGHLEIARRGDVVFVTLQRPEVLNALSLPIYRTLSRDLSEWAADPGISAVVVRGAGDRAFSCGGDIRLLYDAWRAGDGTIADEVFRTEYALNRAIARFPKPWIALMDGITMGGGCGLALHGSHRVATERTRLAMPEAAIGFFPDVGASHFLNRAPAPIARYLGLTGAMIGAADACRAGLASHVVASSTLATVADALAAGEPVDAVLATHTIDPGPAPLEALEATLERIFGDPDGGVAAIHARLAAESGIWADETAERLSAGAPFSHAVTDRLLRRGVGQSIEACMAMEFRVAVRMLARDDLYEGIRAMIVDKDRAPRWSPADPGQVDAAEVEACFGPLPDRELLLPPLSYRKNLASNTVM